MPITETWWNPYRLLHSKITNNVKGITSEKFNQGSFTGSIEAELTNLTLFFVGENKNDKQQFIVNKENIPFIPGTSLKGMIRSLAEYINGDPPVVGEGSLKPSSNHPIPMTFNMFGFMGSGTILKGKVSFSDAKSNERIKPGIKKNYMPGSPKSSHTAFYEKSTLRKFYFHMANPNPGLKSGFVPEMNNSRNNPINIDALEPGFTFKFNVYFENLSEAEFQLLLYSLALENDLEKTLNEGKNSFNVKGNMSHKLGRAKSYGLGSVKIKINSIKLLPNKPMDRYKSYSNDNSEIYQDSKLETFINENLKSYYLDKSEHMENLRKMMIFDPENQTTFKYPDYHWFKGRTEEDKPNSQIPLKKI